MKLAHTTTLTISKSEFVRHSLLSFFSKPMRIGMKKAKLLRVDKKNQSGQMRRLYATLQMNLP